MPIERTRPPFFTMDNKILDGTFQGMPFCAFDIAVYAVAAHGTHTTADEIADRLNMPLPAVQRAITDLREAGLLSPQDED